MELPARLALPENAKWLQVTIPRVWHRVARRCEFLILQHGRHPSVELYGLGVQTVRILGGDVGQWGN